MPLSLMRYKLPLVIHLVSVLFTDLRLLAKTTQRSEGIDSGLTFADDLGYITLSRVLETSQAETGLFLCLVYVSESHLLKGNLNMTMFSLDTTRPVE